MWHLSAVPLTRKHLHADSVREAVPSALLCWAHLPAAESESRCCLSTKAPGAVADVPWALEGQTVDIFRVMCHSGGKEHELVTLMY